MSNAWDKFDLRMSKRGGSERDAILNIETYHLKTGHTKNLSFDETEIDDELHTIAVIDTDNLNEKMIYSLPGEDIPCGGLVFWKDNYWLVTERDVHNTIYTRAKMIQCNYLLRWVSDDCTIHEQWCIVEDGTKYLTGEFEDRNFVVTRGDSRIALTIAKNKLTSVFHREMRFIIDDPESIEKMAYLLTKPLKVGSIYNNAGVYKFVLQEVVTTEDDNLDLMIADYYKHFPKDGNHNESDDDTINKEVTEEDKSKDEDATTDIGGKKVWI